jgi:hypothetical protein
MKGGRRKDQSHPHPRVTGVVDVADVLQPLELDALPQLARTVISIVAHRALLADGWLIDEIRSARPESGGYLPKSERRDDAEVAQGVASPESLRPCHRRCPGATWATMWWPKKLKSARPDSFLPGAAQQVAIEGARARSMLSTANEK